MFKTSTSRRVRAILFALLLTFGTNLAISFVAKASSPNVDDRNGSVRAVELRSGNQTTPPPPIKPNIYRSGNQTTPPPPPPNL